MIYPIRVKEILTRKEYRILAEEIEGPFMVHYQYKIVYVDGTFIATCGTKEAAENLLADHLRMIA